MEFVANPPRLCIAALCGIALLLVLIIKGKLQPLIALAVRISVGSATVAMTMSAGMIAAMPITATLPPLHLACVVMAIAGGSTAFSHVNDSGFWLVKSLCNLDEKTTFKTWTLMETLVGTTGFAVALIVSFFA